MVLPKAEIRRGLRISTLEGSAASVHNVLVGSAFLTGFALVWGANDFQLGLLGAIPFLGALFQFAGAYVADRWPDRRRLTVALIGLLSRGTWFVIAGVPFLCGDPCARAMTWILALYLFYQATQNASGPGWVAWMAVLVPPPLRGRYLGRRNLVMESFGLVAVLLAGVVLDAFRASGLEKQGFMVLQLCAGLAGVVGFLLMLRQPDPGHCAPPPELSLGYLLRPLRDDRFRRLVVFYLCWLVGMTVCTPFMNAHLLKNMHWDFKGLSALALLSSLAAIVMNTVWGRLSDAYGSKPVLALSALGLLHLPLYYVLCPWDLRWPIYVCSVLNGVFLSGFNLAQLSLTFGGLPKSGQAMGSAVMAAVSGPAVFLSGAASGWAAEALAGVHWQFGRLDVANYQLLFAASVLLRLPAFLLLHRIREPGARRVRELLQSDRLRKLGSVPPEP